MPRADAVIIPKSRVTGSNDAQKESVVALAESFLECGPQELAWCRDQMSYYFCTRDTEDTELYPTLHEQAGQPRYLWTSGENGVKFGFLK